MGPRLSDLIQNNQQGTYRLPMYKDEHQNRVQATSPSTTTTSTNKKDTLDLSMTELTKLPSSLAKRSGAIRILKLNSNYLRTLSHDISKLKNLRELHLQYNQQEFIHPSIWCLPNLELLDLSFNTIQTVPGEISCLERLTKLYLAYNILYKLPEQFSMLHELRELDLSCNKFTEVPLQIFSMNNLQKLNLENNNICHIPKAMSKLKGLHELNLLRNPINTIHQKAIDYLLELRVFQFGTSKEEKNILTNPTGGKRLNLPSIPCTSSTYSGSA